jgi:hypothetical protein
MIVQRKLIKAIASEVFSDAAKRNGLLPQKETTGLIAFSSPITQSWISFDCTPLLPNVLYSDVRFHGFDRSLKIRSFENGIESFTIEKYLVANYRFSSLAELCFLFEYILETLEEYLMNILKNGLSTTQERIIGSVLKEANSLGQISESEKAIILENSKKYKIESDSRLCERLSSIAKQTQTDPA